MPKSSMATFEEKPLTVGELFEIFESILESGDREAAKALLPELRRLREKVIRLRKQGFDVGLSSSVRTIAYLAGVEEEFQGLE